MIDCLTTPQHEEEEETTTTTTLELLISVSYNTIIYLI